MGALTWARLSFRQQRWELILVVIGVAAVAAAMLYFATTLDGMRAASPECLANLDTFVDDGSGPAASCQAVLNSYYEAYNWGTNFVNLAWLAPFGMGVILGAPLVAREIDGGTAQLAWSLSRSRVGWLLRRIAFVTLFGLGLLAVVTVMSGLLTGAMFPEKTLGEDFIYFGRRDLPVVARGFGALMVGVLVGAIVGRVLPAILASVLVIGLVFTGLSFAHDQWNRGEARVQRFYDDSGTSIPFDMSGLDVGYGLQRPNGEFLSYGDAYASGILIETYQDEQGRVYASMADMDAGRLVGHDARSSIPGERYPDLVLRDSGVAVLVGVVALGLTAVVVRRRRPR